MVSHALASPQNQPTGAPQPARLASRTAVLCDCRRRRHDTAGDTMATHWHVTSRSQPDRWQHVILFDDDTRPHCTCDGYPYRNCPHIAVAATARYQLNRLLDEAARIVWPELLIVKTDDAGDTGLPVDSLPAVTRRSYRDHGNGHGPRHDELPLCRVCQAARTAHASGVCPRCAGKVTRIPAVAATSTPHTVKLCLSVIGACNRCGQHGGLIHGECLIGCAGPALSAGGAS